MSAITHNEITHSKYSIFCGRDPESEIGDPEKYFGLLSKNKGAICFTPGAHSLVLLSGELQPQANSPIQIYAPPGLVPLVLIFLI